MIDPHRETSRNLRPASRGFPIATCFAAAVAACVACGPPIAADAVVAFTDITDQAGVGLPDLLTESVAWGDYDADGDPDLYLTSNGRNHLFRNDLGGAFTDVTAEAGVGDTGFGVGTAFGDLDNDGDLDLYVTNFGVGPDVLYRNNGPVGHGGETTFTNVTATANVTLERSSRGMALIDYNRDGLLDIYVNAIGDDILYRNDGSLNFTNVADRVGIKNVSGQGVGVVATDVNNDGWVDLFTGNRSNEPNRLFLNERGQFTDVTGNGITEVGLGMGVVSLDYDNDLDFDLYWTTWPSEVNALYENQGGANPQFVDMAAESETTDPFGWGISVNAADVDNDGWMDFFVTNGFSDDSTANVLYHNRGDGTFADATPSLEGGAAFDGRGVAFADFDNDGDLDLIVTADAEQPTRLWRNDSTNDNHFLAIELESTGGNRTAIGARVEVTTVERTTVQEVSGGAGRGSANERRLLFGLGVAEDVTAITIRWPDGHTQQIITTVAADQLIKITEAFADFDLDGDVDGDDFLIWQSEFITPFPAGRADADGDGDIDGNDFLVWQREFGIELATRRPGLSQPATSAPEPSAFLLLLTLLTVPAAANRPARKTSPGVFLGDWANRRSGSPLSATASPRSHSRGCGRSPRGPACWRPRR